MENSDKSTLYQVRIDGEGVSVNKSVSAEVAQQIIAVVLSGRAAYAHVEKASGSGIEPTQVKSPAEASTRKVSLREFLDESQASRNPDKITAIAEYLYQHGGVEVFTRDDIKGKFRSAGEAAPGNFPRDFTSAVKIGWIAEDADAPGSYYVTQTGRAAIESRFSGDVKKPIPRLRRRTKKADNSTAEEQE